MKIFLTKYAVLCAAVLLASWQANAQTSSTRAQLESNINAEITTNGTGQITGAILNKVLQDQAASTATLLDANSLPLANLQNITGPALLGSATSGSTAVSTVPLGSGVSTALGIAPNAAGGFVSVPNTDSCIYQNSASAVAGCGTTVPSGLTAISPFDIGGGSALTFSINPPNLTGTSLFIPSATDSSGNPAIAIERSTTYSGGSTTSPTLFIGTLAAISASTGWVDGVDSELEVTANSGSGAFAESQRARCIIDAAVSTGMKCTGGVFIGYAASGATSPEVFGIEAETDQFYADAPVPASINADHIIAPYFASNGNNNSAKIADAAFIVNPFSNSGFQAGFECPLENSAGTVVRYACFEAAETATYGLDLALGTWTDAIHATGFTIDNAGNLISKTGSFSSSGSGVQETALTISNPYSAAGFATTILSLNSDGAMRAEILAQQDNTNNNGFLILDVNRSGSATEEARLSNGMNVGTFSSDPGFGNLNVSGAFYQGGTAGITKNCTAMPTQIVFKGGIVTSVTGGTCS